MIVVCCTTIILGIRTVCSTETCVCVCVCGTLAVLCRDVTDLFGTVTDRCRTGNLPRYANFIQSRGDGAEF